MFDHQPRVLVLLAAYNGAEWLSEQMDSILAQQDVAVDVVVADDCSRDATATIVATIARTDARVCLHAWEASTGSAGGNFRRLFRHADAAGFDFVALADQDDVWHPRKLAQAILALDGTGADAYSSAVQAFWPDGRTRILCQAPRIRAADFLFEGAGQGCTFVMRAPMYAHVRQFCIDQAAICELLHYHDWLVYLLVRCWNGAWYFDQQPWMRYRQHAHNEIGSRGGPSSLARRMALIRDGWYRKQIDAALTLCAAADKIPSAAARFACVFATRDSIGRRVRLSTFFLRHGRRRLADRLVMVAAALIGWI